ncbi:hypothetical protein OAJ94_00860 [Deltaproteobacteria bacterium]|nr:hypothetical protein [Deltaproteobacteria bacterium]
MKTPLIISLLLLSVALSGCVSRPVDLLANEDEGYSFTVDTLNRSVDRGPQFNLSHSLKEGPMILLWVSTGCYGCHEWTDLFFGGIENGTLSNQSIISIHRYSDFESLQKLHTVYGSMNNSTHPTSWPVLIPNEETPVVDAKTGSKVNGVTIYEAFEYPVTPTLQIVNQQGVIVWTSDQYKPTQYSLNAVIDVLSES